jgi:hypothetical protein
MSIMVSHCSDYERAVCDVILKMPIVCIQSSQNIKKVYNINFTKTGTGSANYVFQVTIKSIQNNQSVNFNVWKTRTKRIFQLNISLTIAVIVIR